MLPMLFHSRNSALLLFVLHHALGQATIANSRKFFFVNPNLKPGILLQDYLFYVI